MPRYIDADVEVSKYVTVWDCNCSEFGKQTVMAVDDLHYLPTADVAPRAEVAREIFDEIENLLSANMSGELRGDSIEWFDYFDLHLAEDIAELKNEYTEAEPPKGE